MKTYFSGVFKVVTDYTENDIVLLIDQKRDVFNKMQLRLAQSQETSYNIGTDRTCMECNASIVSGFVRLDGTITETSRCFRRCGYNEKITYNLDTGELMWTTWFDEDEQDKYEEECLQKQEELNVKQQELTDSLDKQLVISDEDIDYLENFDPDELLDGLL